MKTDKQRITSLEKRIADLEARIAMLDQRTIGSIMLGSTSPSPVPHFDPQCQFCHQPLSMCKGHNICSVDVVKRAGYALPIQGGGKLFSSK